MSVSVLRLIQVICTAIAAGFGAVATTKQIKEGNKKRIEADRAYLQKTLEGIQPKEKSVVEGECVDVKDVAEER